MPFSKNYPTILFPWEGTQRIIVFAVVKLDLAPFLTPCWNFSSLNDGRGEMMGYWGWFLGTGFISFDTVMKYNEDQKPGEITINEWLLQIRTGCIFGQLFLLPLIDKSGNA